MEQLNNKKILEPFRKNLRNNLTPAEAALWGYLKGKQMEGRKFRRQHSFGNYILDFYCPSEKLAIELDGEHHFTVEGAAYDLERTRFLNAHGISVIRFENKLVFERLEFILDEIKKEFIK